MTLPEAFKNLTDPRVERHKRHSLEDILLLTICAFICGADSWTDVEDFGHAKADWFKTFLTWPNGIPSHDTLGRVFARLDPEGFRQCFVAWMDAVAEVTQGEVVAIDGKTLRRSYDRAGDKAAIHMVSAWAAENGVVLGQYKTQDKSNEITAIPALLNLLALDGCVVTIDAMGCQKAIAVIEIRQKYGKSTESTRVNKVGVNVLGQQHRITTNRHVFTLLQTEAISERVLAWSVNVSLVDQGGKAV